MISATYSPERTENGYFQGKKMKQKANKNPSLESLKMLLSMEELYL